MVILNRKKNYKKKITDQREVLIKYAQSKKSYSQLGAEIKLSKVRIFQIVKQEKKRILKKRIEYWKNQGLSLREIARLFGMSHERMRQIINKRFL